MKIGYIQTSPVRGDAEANLAAVAQALETASADLWVLPELFSTGYLFQDRDDLDRLAEPLNRSPTLQGLVNLAGQHGCAIVAGIAEKAPDGHLFNSSVGLDGKGLRTLYRKIHLFDNEKKWFDRGDIPLSVVELAGARVGMMICYDWRFPEMARTLALGGAQVIAHPSNLVLPHCQDAMVTRALENRIFTVTANRIGAERTGDAEAAFTGASRIVSPDGRVLADGPTDRTDIQAVEIDPSVASDKHINSRNDLFEDRRPSYYTVNEGSVGADGVIEPD